MKSEFTVEVRGGIEAGGHGMLCARVYIDDDDIYQVELTSPGPFEVTLNDSAWDEFVWSIRRGVAAVCGEGEA